MEKEEEDGGSDAGLMQRVESSGRRNNSLAYDGDEIEIGVLPPILSKKSIDFLLRLDLCWSHLMAEIGITQKIEQRHLLIY
jgi:hypothetical protein